MAHVDAGKTSMAEAMLYKTGAIRQLGRVDHKDAFLDTQRLERRRGITIFSKQAIFDLGDTRVTLLDTPGHMDFSAEMERTLSVLDYAILVISGPDGVQAHTATVWALLQRYQVPTFLWINKMDLVDFSEEVFKGIVGNYHAMIERFNLEIQHITFIPMSAKDGDNVVNRSQRIPWYDGPSLLEHLETLPFPEDSEDGGSANTAPCSIPHRLFT